MITLENKTVKLEIDELGAQWTSLFEKESHTELLFQKNPTSWNKQAPLLFPIVGRLKDNQFIHFGQVYNMNQHGFLRDLVGEVVEQTSKSATLKFTHNEDTLKVYPFEFEVLVTNTLKRNRVVSEFLITNLSSSKMYYNLGGHPGFIIDRSQENKIELEGKNLGQFILEGPYVSNYQALIEKEFDFNDLDLNATFVVDEAKSVTLKTQNKKIKMSMKPSGYFGLWAPINQETNQLEDMVCIEPWWGISDCVDHNHQLKDKKGILKLNPLESSKFEFTVSLDIDLEVPKVIGPYSLTGKSETLVYTSGQLPLNPETNTIEVQSIEEQTFQSLQNVKAVLKSEGCEMSDVIKTTVYLKNMDDFAKMNEVYGEMFDEPYPARSAIEVARLPKDALVEIEVIAKRRK